MDPEELVRKAISSGLTNCCWMPKEVQDRMDRDRAMRGWRWEGILAYLREYIADHPEAVEQRREQRPDVLRRRLEEHPRALEDWFRVILPMEDFVHGLFVEIILVDPDPDYPI